MDEYLPWNKRLRRERKRILLTQEELAEKVGVDARVVRSWESGQRFPSMLYRRTLCEIFQKSPEELGLDDSGRVVPEAPAPVINRKDESNSKESLDQLGPHPSFPEIKNVPPVPVKPPAAQPSIRPFSNLPDYLLKRRELILAGVGAGLVMVGISWGIIDITHRPARSIVVSTPTGKYKVTPISQRVPSHTPTKSSSELGSTLYVYKTHSQSVFTVAWSPSGDSIVSGSADKTVRVWDPSSGHPVDAFTTSGIVYAVVWSPDGKHIASGGGDKAVEVWDLASGLNAFVYTSHTDQVYAVAWSPDGTRIASAGQDRVVRVWYPGSGKDALIYADHTGPVYSMAWSPDGTRIASASADKTVRVWDAVDGRTLRTYRGHADQVYAVAWSPDGTRIASGGLDKTVEIWNASDGTRYFAYLGDMQAVQAVAWSPHGKYLVTGGSDKTVKIWDAADGYNVLTCTGHTDQVYAVTWSPDGARIASASADKTVRVWNTSMSASS